MESKMMSIKVVRGSVMRRFGFNVQGSEPLARLKKTIHEIFPDAQSDILKWKDDENELCTIDSEEEFQEAVTVTATTGKTNLKIFLLERPATQQENKPQENKSEPTSASNSSSTNILTNGDIVTIMIDFFSTPAVTAAIIEMLRAFAPQFHTIQDQKSASALLDRMLAHSVAVRDHQFTTAILPHFRAGILQKLQRVGHAGPMIQSFLPMGLTMLPGLLQGLPNILAGVLQQLTEQGRASEPFNGNLDFLQGMGPMAPFLGMGGMGRGMGMGGMGMGGMGMGGMGMGGMGMGGMGGMGMGGGGMFGPGMFQAQFGNNNSNGMPPFAQAMAQAFSGANQNGQTPSNPLANLFGAMAQGQGQGQGQGNTWQQTQSAEAKAQQAADIQLAEDRATYAKQLQDLENMGFIDTDHNLEVLKRFNGDMQQVCGLLADEMMSYL